MIKIVLFTAFVAAASCPAFAQSSQEAEHVRATLLSGWQTPDGTHMAGLELQLSPGWKTYWRAPGEAGIPPLFNWSGSQNVKSVRIHWPRPVVFQTNGLQSIGYHDGVVLPLDVTAIDPAQPVHLRASVDLGVCKDICLPASISLQADLVGPGAPDAAIKAALAAQPTDAGKANLAGISCQIDPISDGLKVTATLRLPKYGPSETVAFETGQPDIWVAQSRTRRTGDHLVSTTDFVPPSGAPFALDRSKIRLTVIAEDRAFEVLGCPAS